MNWLEATGTIVPSWSSSILYCRSSYIHRILSSSLTSLGVGRANPSSTSNTDKLPFRSSSYVYLLRIPCKRMTDTSRCGFLVPWCPSGGRHHYSIRSLVSHQQIIPPKPVPPTLLTVIVDRTSLHHFRHVRIPRTPYRRQDSRGPPRLRAHDTVFRDHVDVDFRDGLLSYKATVQEDGRVVWVRDGGGASFHGWEQQFRKCGDDVLRTLTYESCTRNLQLLLLSRSTA